MTKNEARDILTHYNLWRRGEADDIPDARLLGVAIDTAVIALGDSGKKEAEDLHLAWMNGYYCGAKMKRSSIAQGIRDAAVSGDMDSLGHIEFDICTAFSNNDDWVHWTSPCYFQKDSGLQHPARTFMLLVAEALE